MCCQDVLLFLAIPIQQLSHPQASHPQTSHPHPDDLVAFFKRCHAGLKPGGVLFVKENVCKEGFEVDEDDSSVTRSHEYMLQLFKRAELRLLYSGLQKNFPPQLYKVRMYALQPNAS